MHKKIRGIAHEAMLIYIHKKERPVIGLSLLSVQQYQHPKQMQALPI